MLVDAPERQLTTAPCGHILTNANVWSPDGQWIVFDTRSDASGSRFDGRTIEVARCRSGEVRRVYESPAGAHCGVATFHPSENRVVFIHGPERPTRDWQYAAYHRRGVLVDLDGSGEARTLDARDLVPPFTPGALRGGTHVHVFSPDGEWVSFTYEDHVLAALDAEGGTGHEPNQRNIGVSVVGRPVEVPKRHRRNHDGVSFSVLVTTTVRDPRPGSDEIRRACEEGWVGRRGYRRADGAWQRRALAFQGEVVLRSGRAINEVYVVDIPEDVSRQGNGPLQGTTTRRPCPPRGTEQRRLTFTGERKYPGIQGSRHWLRSSADGARIAFLMRDEAGVVQIWTVSPAGGEPVQVTRDAWNVESAFSWSSDGEYLAYIADGSVHVVHVESGAGRRLTRKRAVRPRPEACVFSPDGKQIAFVRPVEQGGKAFNQIFVVEVSL